MSGLRIDFLNWRPDQEVFGNDGLTQADNVIHDAEGWKPVHLASSGSFATTGGLAASNATVLSLVAKPVGAQGDVFCAWLANQTTPTLHVGINGATETTSATGYPLAFATAVTGAEIWAFDVCELNGKVVWTVEARAQTSSPATTVSLAFAGYMDY
ncbi:MAG: hypothetical protein HC808_10085 [Candidatus Competibacteraceae bacterium]|nr:hypothetical protein [Candidatus Competibacteraceae bacterium]